MRTLPLLLAAAALLPGPAPARADLSKVDRAIGKEPAYAKQPRYCLLVFGPEAKARFWLVQDGDTLYIDRNGNGDLTDDGEKVTRLDGKGIDLRDGALTHKVLAVHRMQATEELAGSAKEFRRIKDAGGGEPWFWTVRVAAERPAGDARKLPRHVGYVANGDGLGWLVFGRRPQDAPVVHLNGPWTMDLQDVKQRLTAGRESMLQVGVGSRGVGAGTFSWVLYKDTIPADAYPEAEVTFPPGAAGAEPVRRKYTLKQRC
jgi:hypothetical protein